MQRLEDLKGLLAERDVTTPQELAAELGVSVRTLHRDLAMLRELGAPIDGDRGRGGGLRLEQGWSMGRVHLNESEAMGLLLSLTIAEKIGSPLPAGRPSIDHPKGRCGVRPAQGPPESWRFVARILVGAAGVGAGARVVRSSGRHHRLPDRCSTASCTQQLILIPYEDQHGVFTERDDRDAVPLLQRPGLVRAGLGPPPPRRPLLSPRPRQERQKPSSVFPAPPRRRLHRGGRARRSDR